MDFPVERFRELDDTLQKLRRRLGELREAFQQESVKSALQALHERSVKSQRIDFDQLTGDEAGWLLCCLEQVVLRQLVEVGEQLVLNQQTAANN